MKDQHFSIVFVTLLLVAMFGCDRSANSVTPKEMEPIVVSDVPVPEIEIGEPELEVIRFVLNSDERLEDDRSYFLTSSPMSNWGEKGEWKSFSPEFHKSIKHLNTNFRPADEAFLKDGHVLEKSTKKSAWMQWVTIKKWISPTEVEVEEGVWTAPLGGGAQTIIYEKRDGEWHFKKSGPGWAS